MGPFTWDIYRALFMAIYQPFSNKGLTDAKGLRTIQSKVKANQGAPIPINAQEPCSFLGLLTYYAKFILNLALLFIVTTTYSLTHKSTLEMDEYLDHS